MLLAEGKIFPRNQEFRHPRLIPLTAVFRGVDNCAEENRSSFIWALVLPIIVYGRETWSIGARKRGRLNHLIAP